MNRDVKLFNIIKYLSSYSKTFSTPNITVSFKGSPTFYLVLKLLIIVLVLGEGATEFWTQSKEDVLGSCLWGTPYKKLRLTIKTFRSAFTFTKKYTKGKFRETVSSIF